MNQVVLQLRNVFKSYTTQKDTITAISNISLDIYQGEIFGLLGTNGAGKTTLSSLIATVHPVSSGTIVYQGKSIYSAIYQYRMCIGLCPQKANFEPTLTVKENLLFAGSYYGLTPQKLKERVHFLMHTFELTPYAHEKPSILSGGYKQRLLIARALVHEPTLVILDEPTVALDPQSRRHVWAAIKQLKHLGITVILTTHYLDEAQYLADRICIMDKGAIKFLDTPERLMATYNKDNLEDVFLHLMYEETKELS